MERVNKTVKIVKYSENIAYAQTYIDRGLIPFTLNIDIKQNGKKHLLNIPKFSNIDEENYQDYIKNNMNGMAIRVGTLIDDNYYVVLLDIDNKEDDETIQNGMIVWKQIIKKKKIQTPTQKTGNNGLHYLFKVKGDVFDELPASITGLIYDNKKTSIDFKGKNQFMIVEPSKYDDKIYKWTTDIKTDIQVMPQWLLDIIIGGQKTTLATTILAKRSPIITTIDNIKISDDNVLSESDKEITYNDEDIEYLLTMLSDDRLNNYDEWIKVGMCLHNINKMYLLLWKKWSQKSNKYEKNTCEIKWKTFAKNKETGLKIGSLLKWCSDDDSDNYKLFMRGIKVNNIINKKFPDINLRLGETKIVNKNYSYTQLNNDNCIIFGDCHENKTPSMYVEMIKDLIAIKCKHIQCFGKIYPCEHVKLSKNEMNVIFNYNINLNVNNIVDDVEFNKIDLFDTDRMNDLVYKGLACKPEPYAEIIYELYNDKYMYTENEDAYIFENHCWHKLSGHNANLRKSIRTELRAIYTKVKKYYIEKERNKSKSVIHIKNLLINIGGTQIIYETMREVKYIYMTKNLQFAEK